MEAIEKVRPIKIKLADPLILSETYLYTRFGQMEDNGAVRYLPIPISRIWNITLTKI